jgi:preprotein translocase subunit SecF
MYQIIQKRTLWLGISVTMFVISLVFISIWGLKPGLDFTGGSMMSITFKNQVPTVEELNQYLAELKIDGGIKVQPAGTNDFNLRFQSIEESVHQEILKKLTEKYDKEVQEERFDSIGASVGKELKTKAIYSIIFVVIAIILYMAWAFRKVSWPVASWKYGLIAIIALLHDITITVGIFSLIGTIWNIEVDLPFIAALLTILGYSVHDTIVIFDRTRENLGRLSKMSFADIVNRSVNETLARSVNTTVTVLLALLAIFLFGGESIRYFALTLLIGISLGSFSSIFVASPLLVVADNLQKRK